MSTPWAAGLGAFLLTLLMSSSALAQTPQTPPTLAVHTTAPGAAPLAHTATLALRPASQSPESEVAVQVHTTARHQAVLGIGGAITDATAEVFAALPPAQQQAFLTAYFDPVHGIGYSLLRTTIHSSDFSSASYTYVAEGDTSLASFDLAPDRRHRIPMIRRAIAAAGGQLTTFASPWSAPAWMKDNASMLQGGRLLPAHRAHWAAYLARFVHAYEAEGIPIWGLSVQNEPMARQRWESMLYTAEEERDFVRDHLGPTLRAAGLGGKKLIVWDHNRDLIADRAHVILSDPGAAQYVWGIGYHWYETWAGGEPMYRNVAAVREAWPGVNLLLTEATVERFDPARLNDWANAERYASALINDFNAGAVGWTDWNLLLDERGGPNHVGNFCFAPVHADTRTGTLTFTPSFHVLGHFARFVRPGARRVGAVATRSTLLTTAFVNEDGRVATVVFNTGAAEQRYRLQIDGLEAELAIPPRAIQTLVR
jgi:glucosylceramidase